MAEKDNERKAQRQRKREGKKIKKALDSGMTLDSYNKIKEADASLKASEANKVSQSKIVEPEVSPVESAPKEPTGVTRVVTSPPDGEATTTKYASMAEYEKEKEKENPEVAPLPLISGKDPKTEIEKNVIEQATTYDEMKTGEALGNAVKGKVDAIESEVEKTGEAIAKTAEERAANDDGGTRNTESGAVPYSGDGSAIKDAAINGRGSYSMTDEQFAKASEEERRRLAQAKADAPSIAIEQLGIEHYYPPQQDFLTSNWSGSYIGNRQIVAATGGLYPEGLLDARKRAMEEKAKAKALAADKYWELTSTAPQYDERYKDVGMDILNKYYEATGGDISGLASGNSPLAREFQKDMYDFKARGKMIEDVDVTSRALIATLSDEDGYVPPEIIKVLYEVRDGTEDFDAYMRGETIGDEKMKKIANAMRSYQNFTPLADKQLELLKGLGANELPFAAGTDFNDMSFAANAAAAIESVKHRDYTEFRDVTGKFFDVGEIETIVRNMYATNNLFEGFTKEDYEDKIHSGVRYFMAMLPDKIDIEQKFQDNKDLGWANLRLANDKWATQKEWRKEDLETMYEAVNREMSDNSFRADMAAAHASSSNPDIRAKAMASVLKKYNKIADMSGGYISAKMPDLGSVAQSVSPSTLDVIGADGKQRSISSELSILWKKEARMKAAGATEANNKTYEQLWSDIRDLKQIKERKAPVLMVAGNRTATLTHWDENTKTHVPLEKYNGVVDPDRMGNMVNFGGQVQIETGTVDGKIQVRPSKYQFIDTHDIGNHPTRMILSGQNSRQEGVGFSTEYKNTQAGREYESSSSQTNQN